MPKPLNILAGTLELLVMQTLTATELHGFEILDALRRATDDALVVEEGALYPALHRMEKRGWLAADWAVSEKGRRAKYYRMTAKGRTALAKAQREWERYVDAVAKVSQASAG